jgi:hypothetical protein
VNGPNQPGRETQTDQEGHFEFQDVPAGPFTLVINSSGFASKTISGLLQPGQHYELPPVGLILAPVSTEVQVSASLHEVAQAQIRVEEQQRILGVIPNFEVVYFHDAAPLSSRQKFELAWKTILDPAAFPIAGAIAGVQQANNNFKGYGQGAQGYAKRFGAAYGDFLSGTLIGDAILPSLLRQDPRYFYKGDGTKRSRVLYALANAVVCKGDNGHWQPSYSRILGDLASGGLSNLYYPARDRNGVSLTFENAVIGVGAQAAANLLQEFLVRKLTPRAPKITSERGGH